jgi:hypothetical protein
MASQLIKGLALVSLLGLVGGPAIANEAAPVSGTPENTAKSAPAEHKVHENHTHVHGSKNCKHKAEKHADHVDYEHDGHHHFNHDGHTDECENRHS